MKKFLLSCLVFGLILFTVDRSFILFRYNETNIFRAMAKTKMEKIRDKSSRFHEFETLIIGSSHAQTGISPEIYQSISGNQTFNIAYGGGANLGAQLALLKEILDVNPDKIKVKTIVYGLDVFALNRKPVETDEFQNTLFNNELALDFNNKMYKSFISLYARFIPRYIREARTGNPTLPYLRQETTYDLAMFKRFDGYEVSKGGWIRCRGLLNPKFVRYGSVSFQPDPKAIEKLKQIVSLCKQYKIRLVLIQIPENIACFYKRKKYDDYSAFMKKFSAESQVEFRDFNNMRSFPLDNDSLFFDTDHLNEEGAKKFTAQLARSIN